MKLRIMIEMDNAAFDDMPGSEAARILQNLASGLQGRDLIPGDDFTLRDINGNTVGKAEVVK